MSSRSDAIAGGTAGCASRILSAPFDLVKIRFQLQSRKSMKYNSMLQATKLIVNKEGLWALWKGNISATLLWTTYGAAQFTLYGLVKSALHSADKPQPNSEQDTRGAATRPLVDGISGSIACAGSTLFSYPFDISRTQFAAQGGIKVHNSIHGFIVHTINNNGIRGLYSGLGATLIGVVPYMGLNFALYGVFRRLYSDINTRYLGHEKGFGIGSSAVCGALSGGFSKLIAYPLDTLKRRFQAQVIDATFHLNTDNKEKKVGAVIERFRSSPPEHRLRYKGILDGIKTIFRKEGVRGFYRGLTPSIWKALIATSVNFTVYEGIKDKFDIK